MLYTYIEYGASLQKVFTLPLALGHRISCHLSIASRLNNFVYIILGNRLIFCKTYHCKSSKNCDTNVLYSDL